MEEEKEEEKEGNALLSPVTFCEGINTCLDGIVLCVQQKQREAEKNKFVSSKQQISKTFWVFFW